MPERQESGRTSHQTGENSIMSEYGQPNPPQFQPPKKHTVRNVVIAVVVAGFLLIGGCTALIGGALSSVDTSAEPSGVATVDTPTPEPATTPTNKPSATEGTGCDLNLSPEEYSACLDDFVKGTTATPKPTKAAPKMTAGQEQAIGKAQDYLSFSAFSRKGLIKQLSSEYGEGFSVADATFAVDHITVNWNEQAAKKAKQYLSMQHFSRQGLIHQLESAYGEQFTHRQAVYGVTKAGL